MTIEEIKKMYGEGKTEEEIKNSLRQKGLSEIEVSSSISQAKIKEAVSGNAEDLSPPTSFQSNSAVADNNMYPSIMQPQEEQTEQSQNQETPNEQYYEPQSYPDQQSPQYDSQQYSSQYQPYQSSVSPETISEIAEQIASEKISPISTKIENLISSKTTSESKIQNIQERLERIEKIIDRLQLSIIQKVGDYMNDVSDLKKELIETQKSFKALHKKTSKHHP